MQCPTFSDCTCLYEDTQCKAWEDGREPGKEGGKRSGGNHGGPEVQLNVFHF